MSTRTLSLTLPAEIVDELDARVTAGLAQDIADGIVDAVERTRDAGLEHWVRTVGVTPVERLRAGFSRPMSHDEVLAEIEVRRERRLLG